MKIKKKLLKNQKARIAKIIARNQDKVNKNVA